MDINRQYKIMKAKQYAATLAIILIVAAAITFDFQNRIDNAKLRMLIKYKADIGYNNDIKNKER